jgi:hypothetical protein
VYGEQSAVAAEAFDKADSYQPQPLPAGLIDAAAAVCAASEYERHACRGTAWEMSVASWIVARILSYAAKDLAAQCTGAKSFEFAGLEV